MILIGCIGSFCRMPLWCHSRVLQMPHIDYKALVSAANDELDIKQMKLLSEFGIGTRAGFFFDQLSGKLQFKDAGGQVVIEADVIPIGTYSRETETWLWAWANESFTPDLREKSERLKSLQEITGKKRFAIRKFASSERKAWRWSALAVKHLDAQGCYRVPADNLLVFLALITIQCVAKPSV